LGEFMKKLLAVFTVLSMLFALPASAAEMNFGFSLMAGQFDTDGSETEKTVSGVTSEKTTKSLSENFYGGSIFAEIEADNGIIVGLDYIPLDIKLGSGARTDSSSGADDTSEADTGDRSAEANVKDLYTIYAHYPIGPVYAVLGYMSADVATAETLPTSSYGDASINGWQYGLGVKRDSMRFEIAYSDFDSISLTSSANTNKIEADADALNAKLSFAF